jgi:pimeloyl-ACP methyl ester carboxylesterase
VKKRLSAVIIIVSLISGCGGSEQTTITPDPTRIARATPTPETTMPPTETPAPTATLVLPTLTARPSDAALPPTATAVPPTADTPTSPESLEPLGSLLSLISQERLFASLEELTTIQPYSGWRNAATEGEAEALDYVADTLDDLAYLQTLGLELERSSFHVFLATELWDTRLYLTTQGQETEVPADAPRGHRHDVAQALRFDSDGALNDSERNPVEVQGDVVLLRSAGEIDALQEGDIQGSIVFLDYALIDLATSAVGEDTQIISNLIEKEVAGLVLVTQFSTVPGETCGRLVGDGTALERVTTKAAPPTLYVRLEDLAPAGISDWQDLAQIEAARLVWDTDVFSPGTSGNLVARIPGADSSQAIILGAHIDSPNSPGTMDNGINSVALLEVARVLNRARIQPEIDLYLVWFGSEELWLYGSQHFVNTHQELLDRTVAAFVMDGIIVALPGAYLELSGWSHSRFGDDRLTFSRYLAQKAAAHNIPIDEVQELQGIASDDGVFYGFVPTTGFAFGSEKGGYAHSPYDTVQVVAEQGALLEQVTSMALLAALETGRDRPELRVNPKPERRALIVASHTEVLHMTPTTLVDMDRALAWEGFDVDVIPYGQAVTPDELADAELVVVLPVIDYPSPGGDVTLYDEAWSDQEIESLLTYVEQGGLLVLTNSAHRIHLFGLAFDENEDWQDVNALSEVFGVVFEKGTLSSYSARTQGQHPLTENQVSLALIQNNGVPFTMQAGETLARVNGRPAVGLVEYGEAGGQVLVLADVGILGFAGPGPSEGDNLTFLRNLARYARTPASQPAYEPVFELAECFTTDLKWSLPDKGYDLVCGYLIVPEDRSQPSGKQVELPVVVFHTDTQNPRPDPVIYLAGGGGFNVMPLLPFYLQLFGDAILRDRDLVVYNQRGAPQSKPSLPCPGYGQLLYDLARNGNSSQEERMARKIGFLSDCHDDLIEKGIKLEMYNSTTNAADANDLRIALGYDQANYYGTSYGTTLGLALLRDHPQRVRSIILDSVQPPQVATNSERAPNAYRAFTKLFSACAADDYCSQTYPDLEATFYRVIDDLNANPAITTAPGWQVSYGGGVFSEAIYAMLHTGQAHSAPRAIYRAAAGDFRDIEPYLPDILDASSPSELDIISAGVFYSLACREEVPFDSYENALALAADLPPAIADHYLFRFAFWQFSLCESWAIEPDDPVVSKPVSSDVPALIFAGHFDPITPSEWGQLAAETLSNSFFYKFPSLGHGVIDSNRCALGIGLQFLDAPTTEPDASCLDNLSGLDFE